MSISKISKKFSENKKVRDIVFFVIFTVVAAGFIGGSYYAGFTKGFSQTRTINVKGVINTGEEPANFSTFWQAWNIVKQKFVDKDRVSDNNTLLYGAISGLFSSLGDPHTVFLPPREAQRFGDDISGQFEGIGAEIGLNKDNQLVVISPLEGTPASNAGLQAGDRILKIDGVSTEKMDVETAVGKIRGKKGEIVVLSILREKVDETKDISIVRGIIQIPTLDFTRINVSGQKDDNGKYAYIQLYNFYEHSPQLFYQTALKVLSDKSQGMILDLRNNPGGYLNAAVSIGGWFVKQGDIIVTEQFQDQSKDQKFVSRGPSLLYNMPVIVLINKGSASASEILAGALKEHDNAILVGETSFGKGTVQEVTQLPDGSMVKVTVAHWLTPQGHLIEKNGIDPDVEVSAANDPINTNGTDPVLQKAIELLNRSEVAN